MRKLTFAFSLIISTLFWNCNRQITNSGLSINSIIGDISFVYKYGMHPTASTDEDLRIKTHLEYVENFLRKKDIANLTPELQTKRNHLLNLLHNYWVTGLFPRNYDYQNERKPCFIDKNGVICAVGYLVEKTLGRQITEQINFRHKYDKIAAMNDPLVEAWVSTSGLTLEECAMIQPNYGPPPNNNYISPEYGITSSFLGGVNLALNTINTIEICKKRENKIAPIISLLTGAGSVVLGVSNFPKKNAGLMHLNTNESQKYLSMINVGFGTTTIILGVWHLCTNTKIKDKPVAWNIYSFPAAGNQVGMGLSWCKAL